MSGKIANIRARISALDAELEVKFKRHQHDFQYQIRQRHIVFKQGVQRRHAALKQKLASNIVEAVPLVVLTAAVIYSMFIPSVLLDVFVTIYQWIWLPVYRIDRVQRGDYIRFDRRHLSYLNGNKELNCLYCSYGYGLFAYAREIAGRTEKQ